MKKIIEQIRQRADIIDIISDHVAIKQRGKNYVGLCPFHSEKTPSFTVTPERNMYKCFGCGEGGDIISFYQKINNLGFHETIIELAQRYNIPLDIRVNNRDKILELNQLAADYFIDNLLYNPNSTNILEYLSKRNINESTIRKYSIGYANNEWHGLLNLFKDSNVDPVLIAECNLFAKKEGSKNYYDRFRDRIMLPIYNERNDMIAFSGRSLNSSNAKYLNSSDSYFFCKGKNLFLLNKSIENIKTKDQIIVTEGYFDAITMHENGFNNTVASMGTALTQWQLNLCHKYTCNTIVALDSDTAGNQAVKRFLDNIKDEYISTSKILRLNDCKDPDEFINKNGIDAMKDAVDNAINPIEFILEDISKQSNLKTLRDKLNAIKELIPVLYKINNPIVRSNYIKIIADKLDIREDDIVTEYKRIKNKEEIIKVNKIIDPIKEAELNLLSTYFINEEYWNILLIALVNVNFCNKKLQLIKQTIEDEIKNCNNINILKDNVLDKLVDNEVNSDISDLFFRLEIRDIDSEKKLELFLNENLGIINRNKIEAENKILKDKHSNIDEDNVLMAFQETMAIINQRSRNAGL